MYERAPRVLRYADGGSTADHVGPGAYQVPFPKQQAAGGYAPFLSLAARNTIAPNTEEAIPGPAHYNVSEKKCNIKGGHSLQNREKRFKKFISDSPGPASYDQSCPGALGTMKRKVLEAKEHLQSKISRLPSVFRMIVPSIPSYGRSYGYHINEDGSIIKHLPPASDITLGPAYYKPQFGFSNATLKYNGIHFGKSLGRLKLPIKSGPGPGQYDIVQKKTYYENINIKKDQPKNYCLHVPRLYEVIIMQEVKKGVPGPGKYDIKSQFEKTESVTPNVNDASHAFLSQSQRFVPVKSTTPAPGTYNESRTAFKPLKKTPKSKNTPFGQNATRFPQDSKTEEIPGPGSYNILNDTVIDNSSKTCLKKQSKSAFGSSAPRTFFWDQKEAFSTPGPAAYQDISSRGSCDVQKSYEMSQVQHRYMLPYGFVDKIKYTSFLITTPGDLDKVTDEPDKYISKGIECRDSNRYLHTNVHGQKGGDNPSCLPTDEYINKMCYIH